MSEQKTELPTPHRIRKAREEGQVAHSKDMTQTVLIAGLFGYLLVSADSVVTAFSEMILLPAEVVHMDFNRGLDILFIALFRKSLEVLLPYIGIVIVLTLVVELWQTGFLISWKALAPSGKKLNVAENVKQMFSAKNIVEFLKSIAKILLLGTVVYLTLKASLAALVTLPQGGLVAVAVGAAALLKTIVIWVTAGYAVLSFADFLWQRHQYTKQLMMSKDEVEREHKEMEGDPHIKHKRKELHKEMGRNDSVDAARNSSVVLTNPTHYAVAVLYRKDITPLPLVIGKGEDALARLMARAAREAGVPVMENVWLTRALIDTATLNEYIPSHLIEAVAEVLRTVRDLKEDEEQP